MKFQSRSRFEGYARYHKLKIQETTFGAYALDKNYIAHGYLVE